MHLLVVGRQPKMLQIDMGCDKNFKRPGISADAVILDRQKILLIKRKNDPFKDLWALPGGFIEYGERAEDAVVREAREETGLDIVVDKLIGVYSAPDRDPRGHTITIAYLCSADEGSNMHPHAADDAADAWWWDISELPKLAFDHELIVTDALKSPKHAFE